MIGLKIWNNQIDTVIEDKKKTFIVYLETRKESDKEVYNMKINTVKRLTQNPRTNRVIDL